MPIFRRVSCPVVNPVVLQEQTEPIIIIITDNHLFTVGNVPPECHLAQRAAAFPCTSGGSNRLGLEGFSYCESCYASVVLFVRMLHSGRKQIAHLAPLFPMLVSTLKMHTVRCAWCISAPGCLLIRDLPANRTFPMHMFKFRRRAAASRGKQSVCPFSPARHPSPGSCCPAGGVPGRRGGEADQPGPGLRVARRPWLEQGEGRLCVRLAGSCQGQMEASANLCFCFQVVSLLVNGQK